MTLHWNGTNTSLLLGLSLLVVTNGSVAQGHAFGMQVKPREDKKTGTGIPGEAIKAWKTYRERFDVSRASFAGEQNKVPSESKFKARGGSRVLVSERWENGVWTAEAWGKNEKYQFRLKRNSRNAPWAITYVGTDDPGTAAGMPRRMLAVNEPSFRDFPLQLNHFTLPMLVAHRSFETTEVRHGRDGTFVFRFRANPKGKLPNGTIIIFDSGRVVLDPAKSWLPIEYELASSASGKRMEFKNTDFRLQDDVWFPQKTSFVLIDRDGKRHQGDAGSIQVGIGEQVPEDEFTLSAFGLPEPPWIQRQQQPQSLPIWQWAALAGIGLFVLGMGFHSLVRRRGRKKRDNPKTK